MCPLRQPSASSAAQKPVVSASKKEQGEVVTHLVAFEALLALLALVALLALLVFSSLREAPPASASCGTTMSSCTRHSRASHMTSGLARIVCVLEYACLEAACGWRLMVACVQIRGEVGKGGWGEGGG